MKRIVVSLTICMMALGAIALADKGVEDKDLGLDKNSVYDTPDPVVAPQAGGEPGENARIDPYFEAMPPVIPHVVDEYLPIILGENQCMECHDLPDQIGEEVDEGDPTPIPTSHYTDLRRSPDEIGTKLIGARYVCSQCHVPQADTVPLVESTYEP